MQIISTLSQTGILEEKNYNVGLQLRNVCRDIGETSRKLKELLKAVGQVNEAFHQNLKEEQMIETAKLLLMGLRRRNEDLTKVEESCELLSEELKKVGRQVEEMTGRLQSLMNSVKGVQEDVKPNHLMLPLPKILP